jgi:hypothetical protein
MFPVAALEYIIGGIGRRRSRVSEARSASPGLSAKEYRLKRKNFVHVRIRKLLAVIAYAFFASYFLQKARWLVWLGFMFWPVVLLSPVMLIVARWRARPTQSAGYLSAALIAALSGYELAFIRQLPGGNQQILSPGQIFGLVTYSVPVLILVFTIVVWLTSSQRLTNFSAAFCFGAAWLMLIGAILLGESYVFGSSAKACGGLGWGFYGIMISPLFLYSRPYAVGLTIGGITAFLGGGFLPRLIRVPPGRAIALFAILALIVATAGYVATPASRATCSPL